MTVAQVTDAPPGYRNSLKIAVTIAQPSLSAAAYLICYQNIEGMRIARMALGTAQGMPIGIEFWIKTHRPGLYSGSLNNGPVGNWGDRRQYLYAVWGTARSRVVLRRGRSREQ